MADKISPEERLFKIIQEGKKSPLGVKASKLKEINSVRWLLANGIKRFFTKLKPKPKILEKRKETRIPFSLPIKLQEIDLRSVNLLLIVMLAVLTVLVIHSVINRRPDIAKITDAVPKIKLQTLRKKVVEAFKPVAFYIEGFRKRDIFKPLPRTRREAVIIAPKSRNTQTKLKKLVGDLKLVGISWGKFPKVMIRSEKEKTTYFLRQGQIIGATGIKVKTIFRDKVVISYQGEEMELL